MPHTDLNDRRILLFQPLGLAAQTCNKRVLRLTSATPPLGLASLAAYIETRGFEADILDAYTLGDAEAADRALCSCLQTAQPGWLGISCTTALFHDAVRVCRLVRAWAPDTRIVLGGPHVSALRERVLEPFPEIDALIVGEGELALAELMEKGLDRAAEIAGLVYRDGLGRPVYRGRRSLVELDLDLLPFPAYDKLAGFPAVYRLPLFSYPRTPAASVVTSRGCPYACTYCDRSVFGRSFRFNSADYVYRHLQFLKERYRIRHVTFYDDQFTYDRERVEILCDRLVAQPLRMTFNCAVRAEHIDFALMRKMKRAGCWTVSLGIETGDPETLACHRKNPDLALLAERVREIKKAGMRVKGLLMMGLPGESEAAVRRSMDYVLALPLDEIGIARFTPFPGSALYESVRDLGEFDEDWDKMDCLNFQFVPRGMTHEQLEDLFARFYRAYFMRPATLARYASMIWRAPDSWKTFWLNLATFAPFAWAQGRARTRKPPQATDSPRGR
jgi:anaerobic magnesium-protoporphyrin IX monomethyl ester cyclase